MTKYGEFITSFTTIPAGGDEFIAHSLISAPPDKHLAVIAINSYGGDANEQNTIFMIPNMNLAPNTSPKAGDISGAIQVSSTGFFLNSNALGNTDANNRMTIFAADNGRGLGMGQQPLIILPAGYSLVVASFTANTAVVNWVAGGYVCEGY